MTLIFYAQPYDTSAEGFYFRTLEEYHASARVLKNSYGDAVEEFDIQFIDGEAIDCGLVSAIGINQANLGQVFECVETWSDDEKQRVIIAVGECGYVFEPSAKPDDFDVDIYGAETFEELAEQFVADGVFGSLGDLPIYYVDYETIARDLRADYSETEIAGTTLIYRCG